MKIDGRQLAELIGILAIVFSLLFVVYELRLARSIAESETYAEAIEISRNQREYITNNSDVWARGCVGEELTTSESLEFTNIVLDFIGYQFYRWNRAGVGITFAAGAVNAPQYVARNLYNFPGILAIWETGRGPGSPAFKEAVIEQYELLLESGAEKISDVAWCGN